MLLLTSHPISQQDQRYIWVEIRAPAIKIDALRQHTQDLRKDPGHLTGFQKPQKASTKATKSVKSSTPSPDLSLKEVVTRTVKYTRPSTPYHIYGKSNSLPAMFQNTSQTPRTLPSLSSGSTYDPSTGSVGDPAAPQTSTTQKSVFADQPESVN